MCTLSRSSGTSSPIRHRRQCSCIRPRPSRKIKNTNSTRSSASSAELSVHHAVLFPCRVLLRQAVDDMDIREVRTDVLTMGSVSWFASIPTGLMRIPTNRSRRGLMSHACYHSLPVSSLVTVSAFMPACIGWLSSRLRLSGYRRQEWCCSSGYASGSASPDRFH